MQKKIDEKRFLMITIILIILCFGILVLLKFNISNMGVYKNIIPQNIKSTHTITFGTPKSDRSDEWLVGTGNKFYELNHRSDSTSSFVSSIVSACDIAKWGYKFLPNDMAFGFQSMVMYLILFISGIFFFRIFFKDDWLFVLIGAIIITLQPGITWWNSELTYAMFFAIVDLFFYFFRNEKIISKVLCCVGLVLCLGQYIVSAYPAWMIPLGYFAILLLLGIYIQKGEINFKKTDLIYICLTILAIGGVLYCYLTANAAFVESVTNTVYPGKRLNAGGGLSLDYLGHYLLMPEAPFKKIEFLNNSESSAFMTLFPLPWILYVFNYKRLKQKKVLMFILAFSLIAFIYSFVGFPQIVANLTKWSYSFPARAILIGDFAMMIALLLEIYYLKDVKDDSKKETILKTLAINLAMLVFFVYIFMFQKQIVDYLKGGLYIYIIIVILIVTNMICMGKSKSAMAILLVMVLAAGITVNSINVGTRMIEQTPLAKTIKSINLEDKGNWITLDDITISKYAKAQGVECLNALSYPPRLDLFEPIDDGEDDSYVYNRYAHVKLNIDDDSDEVKFKLMQEDAIEIIANSKVLKQWSVKYIISKEDLVLKNELIEYKKVYEDLDGYNIYKLKYN